MASDLSISHLLDELVSGQAGGEYLHENLDLILSWLANPDSESVSRFRNEYTRRNISVDILRGYVFFILKQKLFSNIELPPSEILGLSKNATKEQVKTRYRKLMRVFHPDKAVGNSEDFNEIAEKINRAYRQIRKQSDAPAHLENDSGRVASTVFSDSKIGKDKIENQTLRKIRSKFGGVRQFQLLFFGGLVSLCLFVVVLLYLQSGDPQASHSYSTRANTQDIDDHVGDNEFVKTDSIKPLLEKKAEAIEATYVNANEEANNNVGKPTPKNIDSLVANAQAKLNQPNQFFTQELKSLEKQTDKKQVAVFESGSEDKENPYVTNSDEPIGGNDELTWSASAQAVTKPLNQTLEDLLSDGLATNQSHYENDNSNKAGAVSRHSNLSQVEITQKQVLQQTPTIVQNQQQTVSELYEAKNDPALLEANDQDNKHSANRTEKNSKHLIVEEQVADFLEPSAGQKQINQTRDQKDVAPVKEVEIATLNVNSDKRFAIANIFEKRFVRKFLIKYLESIENGNVAQIKNYLSNTLVIDGVTNNKGDYLKNTYELIGQTSKRSYHVKFVGDVLRLDPGVFRVTVILDHTYVFKNNIVAKESAQKKFDIKRYSNGTEIINISSA